jgi:hypothetical protein
MARQIKLTRHQLEQVITMLALNTRINSVQFVEQSKSGIGPDVTAYFYDDRNVPQHEMDITDVNTW